MNKYNADLTSNTFAMRKIFIIFAFIVVTMFAFSKTTFATTPIDFYLSIGDNGSAVGCSMPYSGNYAVHVYIRLNGTTLCQTIITNATNSAPVHIQWTCGCDLSQALCTYEISYDICRFTAPNYTYCCQDKVTSGTQFCWSQLTGGTPMVDYVTIN